uniref:LAZY1 n=1 Tax=Kalanchoe fedtschenkoi TaxID=63787 RepID=A0A7N0TME5_KALFE
MKLLGWMHRKQRQTENAAELTIGYPFLEDQQNHMKHAYGSKSVRQTYRDYDLRRSFGGLEAATIEENYDEDSSAAAISEIFHGFLAIGTLGSDTASYPSTPAFTTSFESITEKENEVTETELKLISDELERVLAAEAMEDDCNFSSGRNSLVSNGRNSHVSNGRSSHGSTITLSGRQLESADTTGNGNTICPLQGYLFGSALEVQPTTMPKKEQRTSLGELFQRSKAAEDYYKQKSDKSGKREAEKSAIQLMKKILKKTKLHTSSKNTNTSAGATDDITFTETKLTKILQMFQRKVHPESTTTAQNPKNLKRLEIKNLPRSDGEHMLADKNMTITAHTTPKSSIQSLNGQSNPTKLGYLNENGECWIKTDADYLVLEL